MGEKRAEDYMKFVRAEEERNRDYEEFYKTKYEFVAVFGERDLDQVHRSHELAKKNTKEATSILKEYMNAVEPAAVLKQARELGVADEKIDGVRGMEGSKEEKRAAAIALVVEKVRQIKEEFVAVFGESGLDQVRAQWNLARKNTKEATSILKEYMNAVEPAAVLKQARELGVADEKIDGVRGMEGSKEEKRAAAIALVVEKVRQTDEEIESAREPEKDEEPKKAGGKRIKSKKKSHKRKYKKRKSHKRKSKRRSKRR